MATEADWVQDVRRWYFSAARTESDSAATAQDADSLRSEAADPSSLARQWPGVPIAARIESAQG